MTGSPPPDWYPNPSGDGTLRYWDGSAWTAHVAPMPQAAQPQAQAPQPPVPPQAAPAVPQPQASVQTADYAQQAQQAQQAQYPQQQPAQTAAHSQHPQPTPFAAGPASPYQAGEQIAHSAPAEPRPKRPPIWTAMTWAILALGLVIIAGSGWFAVTQIGQRTAAVEAKSAPAVLKRFLSSAAKGDDAWRDSATPGMRQGADGTFAPLYGDYATGKSLKMKVDYTIDEKKPVYQRGGQSSYKSDPEQAAAAGFLVDFDIEFTFEGKKYQTQMQQAVWLTRPFYYNGSGKSGKQADESVPKQKPSSVGPWQVAGITRPSTITSDPGNDTAATSVPPTPDDKAESLCTDMHRVLADLSDSARTRGRLASFCLYGGGKLKVQAKGLDIPAISAGFPIINEVSALPKELIGFEAGGDYRLPISQYPIAVDGKRYVFTAVSTAMSAEGSTEDSFYRLIWLEEAKAS